VLVFGGGRGGLGVVQSSGLSSIGLCLVSASLTLLLDGCTTTEGVERVVSMW
jgi:hypothetical protein